MSAKTVNVISDYELNLRLKIDIEIKHRSLLSINDVTFWLFDSIMGIEFILQYKHWKNVSLAVRGLETS